MKKLICLMGMLSVAGNGFGQSNAHDFRKIKEPLFIDSWVKQDVPLGKFINYKDSTATLNDFKDKLIILDFWYTSCTSCIKQFPKEDSLQKKYGKDIQFILVTVNSAEIVKTFLDKWQTKSGITLSFPIIVEDTILRKAFRQYYNPHYAWIRRDGKVIGQTAEQFVTEKNIEGILTEWIKMKNH